MNIRAVLRQAVVDGDAALASAQFASALKSIALLGTLLMIIGYEAELAKYQIESTKVRVGHPRAA